MTKARWSLSIGALSLVIFGNWVFSMPEPKTTRIPRVAPLPPMVEPTIKGSPIEPELRRLIAGREWPAAVRLCQEELDRRAAPQIIDETTLRSDDKPFDELAWRAMIGEFYLYDLKPKLAVAHFTQIRLSLPPPAKGIPFEQSDASAARQRSASGLARAYAEMGRFDRAAAWMQEYQKHDYHWCGN